MVGRRRARERASHAARLGPAGRERSRGLGTRSSVPITAAAVLRVAAEELVGALARERHGDVLAASSESAWKPRAERSATGSSRCQTSSSRSTRRPSPTTRARGDRDRRASATRRASASSFVGVLAEADRERLHRLARCLAP